MSPAGYNTAVFVKGTQFESTSESVTPASSVHGILQARILEWVAISFSRDLPDPGIEPTSPASAGGCFTTEPPGKSRKCHWWVLDTDPQTCQLTEPGPALGSMISGCPNPPPFLR